MVRVPTPAAAIVFVAGVAVLFVSAGFALATGLGEPGVPAAEWLLLFVPALVFVRLGRYDLGATLLLRVPSLRSLAGGALLVGGATPLAWGISWAQGFVLPVPPDMAEAMRALVTAETPGRLAWLLFAVALTPAISEEAVFRGVLLSSTRALPAWRAVLLNGVVFGAFHLSFEVPVRFLPTAWMGIVITWGALRSGSVWTGVLMHFLNNASIVLLASAPFLSGLVTDPDAAPPLWLLAAGVASLAAGVGVLRGPLPGGTPAGSHPPGDLS